MRLIEDTIFVVGIPKVGESEDNSQNKGTAEVAEIVEIEVGVGVTSMVEEAVEPAERPETVVHIYTDGACLGNPGPGGWAAALEQGDRVREIVGSEDHTTNNRMELTAAVEALRLIKRPFHIILCTDSMYVKNGITLWIKTWKNNGWLTTTNQPVKNEDLWKELDALSTKWSVDWQWVHGHEGHLQNERVDALATAEAAKRKIELERSSK